MSLLATLPGRIKLAINENDHNPPHLHMKCPEGIFKIYLSDHRVESISGSTVKAGRYIRLVKLWMVEHRHELDDRWQAKERGEKVHRID